MHTAAELSLALLATVQALRASGAVRCARTMDEAQREAMRARRPVLAALGVEGDSRIDVRFAAAGRLNALCAACGGCERGRVLEDPVTAGHPRAA